MGSFVQVDQVREQTGPSVSQAFLVGGPGQPAHREAQRVAIPVPFDQGMRGELSHQPVQGRLRQPGTARDAGERQRLAGSVQCIQDRQYPADRGSRAVFTSLFQDELHASDGQ
jgi:hypothetical protein